MPTSSPMKKTIELQANTSTPHGATIRLTVEYRIRPPVSPDSGPIYEDVNIHQHVKTDMGPKGQYEQRAKYTYERENDRSPKQVKYSPFERTTDSNQAHIVEQDEPPEKIIEHISEDEKSTSSEEVVFEEWTEEFNCRRTDEYDRQTNRLLRTTIDETSDRIKGDILKEQYKEKNTRIKGHKSYDVVKAVHQRTPRQTYEEVPQSPPSRNRQWTSEEVYTTEIVQDPSVVRELESTAQKFDSITHYDRSPPSQTNISTYPSSRYEHISNVVTSSAQYADKRKQEPEEVVSEEYQVEIETTPKRDQTSSEKQTELYITNDQQSPTRRDLDWRNKMKETYTPPSDDDQYKYSNRGSYLAQRVSVIPSSTQQRIKEVRIKLPGQDRAPPERRKFDPSPPTRHTMKEPETPKRISSNSPTDDDQSRSPSIFTEHRTQYEPIYSRVGELKNTFETTTYGSTRDDPTKYKSPSSTGFTEQRRRVFEDQEWTRRPINEFPSTERRLSETHTAPSLVSDRVSRFESTQPSKQVISSIDSDLSGPTQPIYQSTPKSYKQKQDDDAGHESEDELSDSKQNYDIRRRTSKTRLRDFSQSTPQSIDVTHSIHRATSNFNETNMEDVLSHVPTSKGKGMLIELSPQSPSKSHLTSDSGVFDYSTSHQLRTSSPSWRQNISTTIVGDTTRSQDTGIHIDSTITSSPYTRRQTADEDQNIDESTSRSTYRYNREILPNQYQQQPQHRTVRRQLTNSPPTGYENLTSYQSRLETPGKVSITTQSRTIKPLVVDEYETVETETQVECQVQRTNEIKETTKTERIASPSRKISTTITTTHSSDETTPARRVLLNDRPQYYESSKDERRFQPIQHDYSQDELSYRPSTSSHTMQVTSLSPTNQITFGKYSPNEIIAVVSVPELATSTIRQGTSESNLYEKPRQESPQLHYQRVHATSYRPPALPQYHPQRQSRSRTGPFESANDYSSPVNFPIRSSSYHTNLHEQQQQQQQKQQPSYRPQTRYHSSSLGNLEFEIEIEKRPPQNPEQPTHVSLNQCSRATVTTSKDGRVSIQNIAAYPGNTVVINSDYHSSDRSLNRSSGYFSSDEPRSQGHTANYSSDEQNSYSTSSPSRRYQTNEQIPMQSTSRYHFDQVNNIVKSYSQPTSNFNEAIDQIDALYNNLDVQTNNQRTYDFSKLNRRKQLTQNASEYSNRYTSTGFQQIPYEQQTSSLTNLVTSTPIRPLQTGILTDYGTAGSIDNIVQQNRLNEQSQIVQRHRTSGKQKNAATRRGQYSDEDDENNSPLSDNGRSQPSPRSYHFNNHYQ